MWDLIKNATEVRVTIPKTERTAREDALAALAYYVEHGGVLTLDGNEVPFIASDVEESADAVSYSIRPIAGE
ncbi:hypothetical protein [Microbacterium sp. SMR1]|uniref:hypothetical protein n=1 Tax=Microbacterium sp. SMR1 TaxID=1497340 RepID=UPI000DCC88F7|nr:hypothetical protein [Microbacterium sp. SMR1]RAZ34835.1 hypothetical protein DO944_03155 [Microbacterium sp. SMR1]